MIIIRKLVKMICVALALNAGVVAMESSSSSSSEEVVGLDDLKGVVGEVESQHFEEISDCEDSDLQIMLPKLKFPKYLLSGGNPLNCLAKIAYLKDMHTEGTQSEEIINFVNQYLNLVEYFFCCPSFGGQGGFSKYRELIDLYDLEKRSWPFHKMPAAIGVALSYDKFVYLPIGVATILGVGYTMIWGTSHVDELVEKINSTRLTIPGCRRCSEHWDTGPAWPDSVILKNPLHLFNDSLGMTEFQNAKSCPGVAESTPFYIESSMQNLTWEDHTQGEFLRPNFRFLTFIKPLGSFDYHLFRLWGLQQRIMNIDVFQCNLVTGVLDSLQAKNPFNLYNLPLTVIISTIAGAAGVAIGLGRYYCGKLLGGG